MTQTSVETALRSVANGDVAEGVETLSAAAERGNVDAVMQLAIWHLIGQPIPRDLVRARALLRRAVTIGHVDAALMEIALAANGSGGDADWQAALTLLRKAASADPVAEQQMALLSAMTLDSDGKPMTLPPAERLAASPLVLRFRRLFSPAECAHVASVASTMLEPARVIEPASGKWVAHPVRTSDGAAIGPAREDLVVRALNLRIAAASGTDVCQGEPLTVLRYTPGQQYRLHHDAIAGEANQRSMTMLIYLNEGFGGGETHFPAADLTVTPQGGDAIVFTNLKPDGSTDPASRHAGLPVTRGAKWLATRWIRVAPIDPWAMG